ncbi:MAG: methyl-accepting chemotaxis protein [Fibromonadaceae bacterium]|jgi:PAS domain S-box-containing protein|nr:methyl-accepting chemotaxis protein [Fibromonadaceae bacterium]
MKKVDSSQIELENAQLKETQLELKLEIAKLKAIQSAMPDPYYVRDMDYNVILWPDSIAKLTGYSAQEAKKLKCYQMFKACVCPPGSPCPTQNCIKTKQFLRDVAVDVYHKSGATVHTLVSNAGVYDEQGNPIGAVEIVKDNTAVQAGMNTIGQYIKDVDSLSKELYTVMEEVSKASDNLSGKAVESFNNVKAGEQACVNVSEKVEYSNKCVGDVQVNMHKINESMKSSVEKISALKMKSEIIIRVVDVIQNIAYKTNLLALNASIEAAKAGSFGKGFAVVAEGIKGLAENSSKSAESIKETIQEIIELIQQTTDSLNITEKDIKAGTKNISELLGVVNDIDNAATTLISMISDMGNVSGAVSHLSEEQKESATGTNRISRDLHDISKNLTKEFDLLFKAIQRQNMG